MNQKQRATLAKWVAQIEEALEAGRAMQAEVADMASEEQDKFDNMPEGLQAGDRGQAIERAAEALQNMADSLDEAITALEQAVAYAEETDNG